MDRYDSFDLPESLRLGCATASAQIEGNETNHSWYEWSQVREHIADGASSIRANQHWDKYEDDLRLMSEMKIRDYRFGIEWSRIEPENGVFDDKAMEHYRDEIKTMLRFGIRPLVTLHHFSNPLWFERMGAFQNPACVELFRRYTAYVTGHLKDLCSEYVTINEPNVYFTNGYVYGTWPPGEKSVFKAFRVLKNMTLCNLHAYRDIHASYGSDPVKVGFAGHYRVFAPAGKNPFYALEAKIMKYLFQDLMASAMSTGHLSFPLGFTAPLGKGPFLDFIGINYYTRSTVKHFNETRRPDCPENDLGWEIYPHGLTELVRELYSRFHAPVWITENGTCDKEDRFRAAYIYNHIKEIKDNDLPVERYYHWTFIDNFEWAEGESAPFGLVRCNFDTQERTVRRSGRFYSEMIENRGVTPGMIAEYL